MAVQADIQQQVYDVLSRASNISFVGAEQEAGTRISLLPGQRVAAEVLSTMHQGNRTQVRVGSERFNLDLPMAVRPGQTLEMTFVSDDPRPTFAIARQAGTTPPVSLSDASRLLSLLVGSERIMDPGLRSSLQSIGDMLRRSSSEVGVLANLMDEALTYGASVQDVIKGPSQPPEEFRQPEGDGREGARQGQQPSASEQARLSAFESNAAQILRQIARSSRFTLTEAVNLPLVPLPLMPGQEVDALITGTLPGGRVFVQVAGTALEFVVPRAVQAGDILRLTYISALPRPLFALPRLEGVPPSILSEAGRWLSVLEHSQGGLSEQQSYVLERLNTVLKSLPFDSPAYAAIRDEALVYGAASPPRQPQETATALQVAQPPLLPGNRVVLSDDMAKLLQALIKGDRLALLEAISQKAPQGIMPGQQMKGEVLATLGGGRFMVQLAGQALEFSLPRGVSRGDRLNLFFISTEPHPTFLLARSGPGGDARVSETGRWLSGFIGEAAQRLPARETMGLLKTLLSEPPVDAQLVGQMLQKRLRESGMFYESHLSRWFGGDYRLDDLLHEPQGQLSRLVMQPVAGEQVAAREEVLRATVRSGSTEAMEAMFRKAGSTQSHEGIADQRLLPLVREQLASLENARCVFHGELLPGQPMEWSVAEREARHGEDGSRERTWQTGISLQMPRLGNISARLHLDGVRLRVDLTTERLSALEQLENGLPRLIEQLEGAGLEPVAVGVHHALP